MRTLHSNCSGCARQPLAPPRPLAAVPRYLLSDYLDHTLPAEPTLELMMLANAYGASRLEQLCARQLATRLDVSNVHEVARCAQLIFSSQLQRATEQFAAAQVQFSPTVGATPTTPEAVGNR